MSKTTIISMMGRERVALTFHPLPSHIASIKMHKPIALILYLVEQLIPTTGLAPTSLLLRPKLRSVRPNALYMTMLKIDTSEILRKPRGSPVQQCWPNSRTSPPRSSPSNYLPSGLNTELQGLQMRYKAKREHTLIVVGHSVTLTPRILGINSISRCSRSKIVRHNFPQNKQSMYNDDC
jgi:hypothetical protein